MHTGAFIFNTQISYLLDTMIQNFFLKIIKLDNFRVKLIVVSSKKEALVHTIPYKLICTIQTLSDGQGDFIRQHGKLHCRTSMYTCPSSSRTTISRTLDNPDDFRATDPSYSTEIALFNPDFR